MCTLYDFDISTPMKSMHVECIIYRPVSPRTDVRYRLWNAVTIYFTSRRFMIAINILINDLLNYNCDRYLPTQLQGGVARNLWHHLSMLHTLLLTTSQFEMCAVIPNVVHIGMLFQLDLTPFVTVMSSFNFRRPDIWLMRLVFMVSIPSDNGIKQIISLTSARSRSRDQRTGRFEEMYHH